jgi:ketosteroid isomerase-like protein
MSRPLTRDDEIALVRAWHEALNRGDIEALTALCHDDVEVGGPRGSARGRDVLRDWAARAGIRLEPRRWFAGDGAIVVEQTATWSDAETGQATAPVVAATLFEVVAGRVRRVVRYDGLDTALAAAGLTPGDEVRPAPG